ncbi:helix-turn-helix domain-containing protein [Bacillus mangrovi]|uniref:Helix-turn-helix domain-containing protein n=1 Tax=Metabacillus mangrovi TaxID=1491830 RepID=A0A7X2V4R1_9BACI|nr:AraC family transcriptional regulator [Metabacillus mangrovi]MTH53386.1 helix-turn-helix domain-containing protein [Metabacillus mangrovi]
MTNETIIQKTIDWIEDHLQEDISARDIASAAGFSKFHFHRIFQAAVGVSFSEYLRNRRMTSAAAALIHTDERIIDIALSCCFESQEVFTRAFKRVYQLPPGQYRKLMKELIAPKEEMKMEEPIKGWFLSGSNPYSYEMGTDTEIVHNGRKSGYLKSTAVTLAEGEFATMMQQFKADQYKGKRMRLSGFLRTKDVKIMAAFWMRVDSASEDILQFDNMSNRPIQGTANWNHYSIVLDVPENSASISFGIILSGTGCVWADGITFEEVDKSVSTTNAETQYVMLDNPVNLSFEEA